MFKFFAKLIAKFRLKNNWVMFEKKEEADIKFLEEMIKVARQEIDKLEPELTSGKHTKEECRKLVKQIRKHETALESMKQEIKAKRGRLMEQGEKIKFMLAH